MKIKDIVTFVSKSITPQKGVTYNLYSLPSFDEGKTFEVLDGADIQSNKYDVPNKCILFNKLNVRFKRVWRIDSHDENKIASTEFLPLVVDEDVVDFQYCYYLLISDKITNYLCGQNTNTSGSHKRIDPENFLNIEIKLPKMSIQRQVGKTLSALDRKIVLNKQINDNLVAMAKQLYDYWFVQFDFPNEEEKPYKSSGGAMVWNEKLKREIPKGLDAQKIGDIEKNIITGKTPSCADEDNFGGDIPFVTIDDIRGNLFVFGAQRTLSTKGADSQEKKYLPIGSLSVSCIGTIGVMGFVAKLAQTNQQINSIVFEHEYNKEFLYFALRVYFENAKAKAGNVFANMSKEEFASIIVTYPPKQILQAFHNKVAPIFDSIKNNIEEINVLTKQRDELLPLLMNGQASVNYHLSASFLSSLILLYRDQYKFYDMKETIIQTVLDGMRAVLTENQLDLLTDVTRKALSECEITPKATEEEQRNKENVELLGAFISSKKVEGCSDKTIHYYKSSIEKLIATVKKNVCDIATNDIRCYLADQQEQRGLSKVTIDNLRRIYSSFFSWLEDEDYITKSPVRRIHKVRTDALVKEVLTDENIEVLRDSCHELRDIAMIDLLLSTGMRVGELVKINRDDIDFQERQCVVFGKGNKEREVYFNARTKIHLKKYLEQRTDTNPALFVSLHEPHTRLTISGVEVRLRQLGKRVNLNKVHPHKFRRTLATMAIDKGMPIEQVQKMLGHVKIDTTLHYAMVNQTNVKIAHRKFLN